MTKRNIKIFFLVLLFIVLIPCYSSAGPDVSIEVKIILASQKQGSVDPALRELTRELQSVLKYSSYELLGRRNIRLVSGGTGSVSMPDNLILKIASRGVKDNRVILDLEIFRNNSSIFKSSIKLRNNDQTTIGGPEYRDGHLLFNIFASF